MEQSRCQAILLTPGSRNWAKFTNRDVRCKFNAKPDNAFCGVHIGLSAVIEEIRWKDNGS